MATLVLTVGSATDDAVINDAGYEDNAADISGSTSHQVGETGGAPTAANSGQGWRFTNVTLSASDTISAAAMNLMKYTTQFATQVNRWTCVNEDNTSTFSSGNPPGSRAIVATSVGETNNRNETDGTVYNYPVLAADQTSFGGAIANVISRSGWASGNALAVVNQSKQDAGQVAGFGRKAFHVFEDTAASSEPQLTITYTPGVTGRIFPMMGFGM